MTTDDRAKLDAGSVHTDQIGKVFVVRRHGLRECMVCGELFTRRTAPEHAIVDCRRGLEDGGNTN